MNQNTNVNQKPTGAQKRAASRNRTPKRYGMSTRNASANRTWLILGAVALVLIVAVVIAASASGGGDQAAKATDNETGTVTVDGAALPRYGDTSIDTAIGDTIPTLSGVSFDGSPVTIGPTGKPGVVIFVAHWCPHCQREVPLIVDLAKSGGFKGIDVATVATGTNATYPNYPPSAWLKRENWPFPVMVDSLQQTAAVAYGLSAYPYFVAVNAKGQVVGRETGEIAPADIKKILSALAAGKPLPNVGGSSSSSSSS
jgi:cytochrome c biogenesis protein CcmG/thiol:disulfide interchange protein DsbE